MKDIQIKCKHPQAYDEGLMSRLEGEFTTEEQGLFLQSFSAYLHHDPNDFVVDLDDVWEWMGFSTKGNAKTLLMKYFREDAEDFAFADAKANLGALQNGGGMNRQRIMLSLDTFEDFCMRAGTSKAQMVRTYFRKMNRVAIAYISETNAARVVALAASSKAATRKIKHDTLMTAYRNTPVVYIAHVDYEDQTYMKIGSAKDIYGRFGGLQTDFGKSISFAYVYPSTSFREIETEVKRWPEVIANKAPILMNTGKLSTETYSCTDAFDLDSLIKRIKTIATRIESTGPSKKERALELGMLRARNEQERLTLARDTLQLQREKVTREQDMQEKLQQHTMSASASFQTDISRVIGALVEDPRNKILLDALHVLGGVLDKTRALSVPDTNCSISGCNVDPESSTESTIVLTTSADASTKSVDNTTSSTSSSPDNEPQESVKYNRARKSSQGSPVQKYSIVRSNDPTSDDHFIFEEAYVGQTEAARQLNAQYGEASGVSASPSGIKQACDDNAEYCGFRWLHVSPDVQDDPQALAKTTYVKRGKSTFIAMVSQDTTIVVQVFVDQQTAAEKRDVVPAVISKGVTKGVLRSGHYWQKWHDVSEPLRTEYLKTHDLPKPKAPGGARALLLFDPQNMTIVKQEFSTVQKAVEKMQVSRQTIEQAASDGLPRKGYVWRWAKDCK